ncbi:unnamed protein product [Closterium sp. Naga37s-1]|nr:unnamed protein product [Closterium sp. Naga37s-1]
MQCPPILPSLLLHPLSSVHPSLFCPPFAASSFLSYSASSPSKSISLLPLPPLSPFPPFPLSPPPPTLRRNLSSLTSCVSVSPSGRLSLSLRPSSLRPLLLLASLLSLLVFRSHILPIISALLSLLLSLPLLFFRLLGFRWAEGDLTWGEWGWGGGGGRGRGRRVVRDRSMGGKEVVASEGWRKWWEGVGGGGESGREGGKGIAGREGGGGVRRWRRGGGARQRGVSPLDIPAETSRSERELRAMGLLTGEEGSGGRAGRLTGRQEEPAWWREACSGAAGMAASASPAVAPDIAAVLASGGAAEGRAAGGGAWSVAREGSEEANLVVQRECKGRGMAPCLLPAFSLPASCTLPATPTPDAPFSRPCSCPLISMFVSVTFHYALPNLVAFLTSSHSSSPPCHCNNHTTPSGMLSQRLLGQDFNASDILQLYTAYRRSGATVSIDSDNSRDALFRAAINTAFSAAAGGHPTLPRLPASSHPSALSPPCCFSHHLNTVTFSLCSILCSSPPCSTPIPLLPPADIPLFLACLAAAIRLPSPRALTMVLAALAARTRSSFLQAWALVKQNRRSEAEEELQRLASIATTLPPPPNSVCPSQPNSLWLPSQLAMAALPTRYGCPPNSLWLQSQLAMAALPTRYGCPPNSLWLPSQLAMAALPKRCPFFNALFHPAPPPCFVFTVPHTTHYLNSCPSHHVPNTRHHCRSAPWQAEMEMVAGGQQQCTHHCPLSPSPSTCPNTLPPPPFCAPTSTPRPCLPPCTMGRQAQMEKVLGGLTAPHSPPNLLSTSPSCDDDNATTPRSTPIHPCLTPTTHSFLVPSSPVPLGSPVCAPCMAGGGGDGHRRANTVTPTSCSRLCDVRRPPLLPPPPPPPPPPLSAPSLLPMPLHALAAAGGDGDGGDGDGGGGANTVTLISCPLCHAHLLPPLSRSSPAPSVTLISSPLCHAHLLPPLSRSSPPPSVTLISSPLCHTHLLPPLSRSSPPPSVTLISCSTLCHTPPLPWQAEMEMVAAGLTLAHSSTPPPSVTLISSPLCHAHLLPPLSRSSPPPSVTLISSPLCHTHLLLHPLSRPPSPAGGDGDGGGGAGAEDKPRGEGGAAVGLLQGGREGHQRCHGTCPWPLVQNQSSLPPASSTLFLVAASSVASAVTFISMASCLLCHSPFCPEPVLTTLLASSLCARWEYTENTRE